MFVRENIAFSDIVKNMVLKKTMYLKTDSEYSVENIIENQEINPMEAICSTEWNDNLKFIPAFLTLSRTEQQIRNTLDEPQQYRLKIKLKN